ncbi:MAG: hypothetical protein J3K34DRAFT_431657 [Monoraphidium minutum]|nr:MAG: hypothetical protein J3K34DRAFT_431657 [Monoraphidium minutum]
MQDPLTRARACPRPGRRRPPCLGQVGSTGEPHHGFSTGAFGRPPAAQRRTWKAQHPAHANARGGPSYPPSQLEGWGPQPGSTSLLQEPGLRRRRAPPCVGARARQPGPACPDGRANPRRGRDPSPWRSAPFLSNSCTPQAHFKAKGAQPGRRPARRPRPPAAMPVALALTGTPCAPPASGGPARRSAPLPPHLY